MMSHLSLSAGVVMVRFLDIAKQLVAANVEDSTGNRLGNLEAKLQEYRALEGLPCSLLPHGR